MSTRLQEVQEQVEMVGLPRGVHGSRALQRWRELVDRLAYAYQPIVNIHTGHCFGVECLLRGQEAGGFGSVGELFDSAYQDGVLLPVCAWLRRKALAKLSHHELAGRLGVFINLDNRELEEGSGLDLDEAAATMAVHGVAASSVCFELSERHQIPSPYTLGTLARRQRNLHKVAIDDFGTGFSGLQTLYLAEPEFIKIDRFFIKDIATDPRKRMFVASIVKIAHLLGTVVIAEGVETAQEHLICRDVGCDLLQGYFVQRPATDLGELRPAYEVVAESTRNDRRGSSTDGRLILSRMRVLPALCANVDMAEVLESFRGARDASFFPVVGERGEAVGIVKEATLREFAYSPYGKDLLRNQSLRHELRRFAVRCPVADVNMRAESILELYSQDADCEGIMVVEDGLYIGFLDARSLLQIINEKSLLVARDQNPLTRLPGNTLIWEHVSGILADRDSDHVLVYFDFDSFKPFNDRHGFRLGDRAILLFAELLQRSFPREDCFLGHVGGDDFFAALSRRPVAEVVALVEHTVARFADDVRSLHDPTDRERGFIEAHNREGKPARFPLLGVSAAVLAIPAGPWAPGEDGVAAAIASLKAEAKASSEHVAVGVAAAEREPADRVANPA
jgi:EAL domain-containing protein (putative c-di-GMP-specific phosphodiesterase class I)/GGDEF domain-containing protein